MVWEKGIIIDGENKDKVRKDLCGAIIKFDQYGTNGRQFKYGWEIDHIKPLEAGGGDEMENLQPLYWKNNNKKSCHYPITPEEFCKVTGK